MIKAKTSTPNDVQQSVAISLDDYILDENDCFSKEWSQTEEQCAMCGMQSICMVLTTKAVKTKGDSLTKIPWVDEIDFSAVPKEGIASIIRSGKSFPIEEVRSLFEEYSKCKDETTVALQVNNFIREYNLKTTSGVIHG